jgi:hypothetical protein
MSSSDALSRRAIGTAIALAALVAARLAAETIDPNENGRQFAWGENAGWVNAEPLGDGGPGMTILDGRVAGWLWSESVGWINLSCRNRGGCGEVEFAVTHDGAGNLGGWGWAENAGWVSFWCGNTASCGTASYRVRVNVDNGNFFGWAWSENLGWISLSCANTGSCATVNYRVQTAVPFPTVALFADGFESGDTSAWHATVP